MVLMKKRTKHKTQSSLEEYEKKKKKEKKKEKRMKGEIKRSHSSNTIKSDNVYTRAREREKNEWKVCIPQSFMIMNEREDAIPYSGLWLISQEKENRL